MKRNKLVMLATTLFLLIYSVAFAESTPYQKYCISIDKTANYSVFGKKAIIVDSVWGMIASYGNFNHQVCYENYTSLEAKKGTSGNISISGRLLAGKSNGEGLIHTPHFKCPNVDYSVWTPKEIEATVSFDASTKKATCNITKVVPRG